MVMGLMWGRRGVIGETGADVEAAGICFHVPAASLEAQAPTNDVAGTWGWGW